MKRWCNTCYVKKHKFVFLDGWMAVLRHIWTVHLAALRGEE